MLHAVENDSDFVSIKTETYGREPNWDTDYELHYMTFNISGDGYVYANMATLKSNPLIRYTCYYDPTISGWTS